MRERTALGGSGGNRTTSSNTSGVSVRTRSWRAAIHSTDDNIPSPTATLNNHRAASNHRAVGAHPAINTGIGFDIIAAVRVSMALVCRGTV
ncbi:MAG: hypothetical protein V3S64_08435 [bacterium]